MFVCMCNPFSDKDVQKLLEEETSRTSVSHVYKSCSGGESPNCGRCIPTLKGMVRDHNRLFTVKELEGNIEPVTARETIKETVKETV